MSSRSASQSLLRPSVGIAGGHEDVLQCGHAGQKVKALEDEPDVLIAQCRQLFVVHARNRLPEQAVFARVRPVQTSENVHQRGLAGTGRSHHGHVVPFVDLEVDVIQRMHLGFANSKRPAQFGCGNYAAGHGGTDKHTDFDVSVGRLRRASTEAAATRRRRRTTRPLGRRRRPYDFMRNSTPCRNNGSFGNAHRPEVPLRNALCGRRQRPKPLGRARRRLPISSRNSDPGHGRAGNRCHGALSRWGATPRAPSGRGRLPWRPRRSLPGAAWFPGTGDVPRV